MGDPRQIPGRTHRKRAGTMKIFHSKFLVQFLFLLALLVATEQLWFQHQHQQPEETISRHLRVEEASNPFSFHEPSYDLAHEQSFGFFTDISESTWKQMQVIHARAFPNYKGNLMQYSNTAADRKKSLQRNLKESNFWNGDNFQIEFHCPMAQRVPSNSEADGPKWVCDPHRLSTQNRPPTLTSHEKDQEQNTPDNDQGCLIYSIGSAGKTQFEFGMVDVLKASSADGATNPCEIHTFDIVSYNKRNGHFDKALEGAATFHNWGLGTPEDAENHPDQFKTLQQTMEVLGHTNRVIDVFKIDCEWCEWFTYSQWLEQDIRQILVETHHAPMPEAQHFFQDLHDAGYVIFSKEANYLMKAGGVEFGFLKLSKEFFIDGSIYKTMQEST